MKFLLLLVIPIIFLSCKKDISVNHKSTIDIHYNYNVFNDTVFDVSELIVNSTNDSTLNYGRIKIIDSENKIYYDNEWPKLRNNSFSLPERKTYHLTFVLYRVINGTEIIDATLEKTINNQHKPNFIQIVSVYTDPIFLDDEISETDSTTFGYPDPENDYYGKLIYLPPKQSLYEFDNLKLPISFFVDDYDLYLTYKSNTFGNELNHYLYFFKRDHWSLETTLLDTVYEVKMGNITLNSYSTLRIKWIL